MFYLGTAILITIFVNINTHKAPKIYLKIICLILNLSIMASSCSLMKREIDFGKVLLNNNYHSNNPFSLEAMVNDTCTATDSYLRQLDMRYK